MATLPAGIIPDAKGRKGAAYYSNVSRIMLDSAQTQSQIIASQTAIGMQAVGGVIDSLNQGFSKYLDYSLAVKEADFAREMRLREVQLREEEMDMKRAEAHEMVLTRALDRKAKEMDNAQREQDVANEPWKRLARAQLSGAISEITTAALEYETGVGGQESLDRAVAVYKSLPNMKRQAMMRGIPPSEFADAEAKLAATIQKLSYVTVGNRELRRADYQKQAYNLGSASGKQIFLSSIRGEGPRDALIDSEAVPWTEYLVENSAKIRNDPSFDIPNFAKTMLKDKGIENPDEAQMKRAEDLVRSFHNLSAEGQAELFVLSKKATDSEAADKIERMSKLPGWENRTFLQIAAELSDTWKPETDKASSRDPTWTTTGLQARKELFERRTIRGGTRIIEVGTLVRAARNRQNLWDIASSNYEKHMAGDYSTFDRDSWGLPDIAGGAAVGVVGKRLGGFLGGEITSAWRTASPAEEQAAASEILKEILGYASEARSPAEAVSRLGMAKAFVDAYKKDYSARHSGQHPTMFELGAASTGLFKQLASNFGSSGSTPGKTQLKALLDSFDYEQDKYGSLYGLLSAPARPASLVLRDSETTVAPAQNPPPLEGAQPISK